MQATIALTVGPPSVGGFPIATSALLEEPRNIVLDGAGNFYFVDDGNWVVAKSPRRAISLPSSAMAIRLAGSINQTRAIADPHSTPASPRSGAWVSAHRKTSILRTTAGFPAERRDGGSLSSSSTSTPLHPAQATCSYTKARPLPQTCPACAKRRNSLRKAVFENQRSLAI